MITGKLNLAALTNVLMEVKGQNGKVQGIFIPIEKNSLFKSEKGNVYLDIVAFPLKEKRENSSHLVKQSFSKEKRDEIALLKKEEQYKLTPIIGELNVKSDTFEGTNNNPEPDKVFDATDDLPF